MKSRRYSGIGFVFDGSGYFGIDIDNKSNELKAFLDGDTDNIIGEFVHTMKSYTERSQSGTGIHIICKGHLPEGRRRNGNVEMYDNGRFFVFTGDICAEYADIVYGSETVKPLYQKYIAEPEPQGKKYSGGQILPVSAHLSVDDIIEKAMRSKSGEKFTALMRGDICTAVCIRANPARHSNSWYKILTGRRLRD